MTQQSQRDGSNVFTSRLLMLAKTLQETYFILLILYSVTCAEDLDRWTIISDKQKCLYTTQKISVTQWHMYCFNNQNPVSAVVEHKLPQYWQLLPPTEREYDSTEGIYREYLECRHILLVGRQEGHLACKKTEWWGAGVVICLERGADLHMAQLMPQQLNVSCLSKIQIDFTFLVLAYLGSPGKRAAKCVCVYVPDILYTLQQTRRCPHNWPFPPGNLGPHLTHGSLAPSESTAQTPSRSVQQILQGSLFIPTDRYITLHSMHVIHRWPFHQPSA